MRTTFPVTLSPAIWRTLSIPAVQIFSFTLLTAAAAQITIPAKPVPFTLQTVFVVLSGLFLGAKKGAYSQLAYLALGAIGLPVFAQAPEYGVGLARFFSPTAGYLFSFPVAAFLAGAIYGRFRSEAGLVTSIVVSNLVLVLLGALYLGLIFLGNIATGLQLGAGVFTIWSLIKIALTYGIFRFSGFSNR